MNKIMMTTLLSAMMASTANAYTVIDNDDFNYTIGGDFEIQLGQIIDIDEDVDVIFDDSVFKNRVTYKLDKAKTVFAHLNFDPRNDDIVEKFYIGTTFANSAVSFGKNHNAADSFGIEGGRLNPAGGGDAFAVTSGTDLIVMQSKFGATNVKLSHDLAVGDGNETDTALFVSSQFGSVGVGFAYQAYELASTAILAGDKGDVWGVQSSFGAGALTLAADYSEKKSNSNTANTTVRNLLGAYKVGKNILWLGVTEREVASADTSGWYAGVNHKLKNNVNVFAEIADDNAVGNDTAFITGVRLKF